MHAVALDSAAPGIARPGVRWTAREHVDVPVQHQMRRAGAEAADNTGQMRFGGTDVRREAVGVQMRQQEGRGRRGIARRIGGRDRNEVGQKLHQCITVLLDPAKDLVADTRFHHVVSRSATTPDKIARR
jgi:hypothetical protein